MESRGLAVLGLALCSLGATTAAADEPARQVDETALIFSKNDKWLPATILSADEWASGSGEDLANGTAWARFTQRIGQVGARIQAPQVPDSALHRTDGYRYLATIVRNALDVAIEGSDTDRPRFDWATRRLKFGMDCPDALYGGARVDEAATYRIRGRRGSVRFVGITVTQGVRSLHAIDVDDLEIAPDGSFEAIASATEHAGNWIPLLPGADNLQVRQFFYDWDREVPASLSIERIDDGPRRRPASDLDPETFARRLDAAATHVEAGLDLWMNVGIAKRNGELNIFPKGEFGGPENGAQDHQQAGIGYFKLAEDEALLIEVTVPKAKYWSFDLGNFWMESLDYANRQTSLNGHQARLDSDGVFRAVIAHRDPGIPNWLDTVGHGEGAMIYRWNFADAAPIPETRVVKFSEIRNHLPPGTPEVSPQAREEEIERRRQHVVRRFSRPL
jgi:hypothetical protein